jgi:hypothetical protein
MADNDKEKESSGTDWMQKLWRPAMGWMYMLICLLDMAIFPILWSALQAYMHMPITQWNPLTLQGAGLFHIAMGAVLGIAAFGRTQEKLAGTAANPTATSQTVTNNMSGNVAGGFGSGQPGGFGGNTYGGSGTSTTGFAGGSSTFGAPQSGGFGNSGGFGSPAPTPSSFGGGGFGSAPAAPTSSWGTTQIATTTSGKKIVPDFDQPVI